MLKPCANISVAPSLRLGATSFLYTIACVWSGTSIMTTSARLVASAAESTSKPAFSARPTRRAGHVADDHGDARVAQVLGVRVALAAEADDGHGLGLDQGKVGVLIVVHAGSPPVYAPPGGCTPNVGLYCVAPDAAT